jgi:integrase
VAYFSVPLDTTIEESRRAHPVHRYSRYGSTLTRAVAWKIIDSNPAKAGVDNPRRQHPEKRPFESWAEIDAIAEHLGPVYGPMIVFAAASGLRPGEWIALEDRDTTCATRSRPSLCERASPPSTSPASWAQA